MILALLVATLVATPAAADHPADAVNGPLVESDIVKGNPTCGQLGDWDHEFKVDQSLGLGTHGPFVDPNSSFVVTITVTNTSDGHVMSFDSHGTPVEGVFVKGGPQGNLYDYTVLAFPVTSDSNLHSPRHGGQNRFAGISHVSFCFPDAPPPPQGEIAIEKTAVPSFDRTHDWEIEKSADPTTVTLNPGDAPVTVTWDVIVTYLGATDSNHKVTGVITVANVGALDANITSLTDLGENVTDCTLNGAPFAIPGGTLAVGDEINCNYSVDVAATDDTNTATVTGTFTDGEGFAETATENFAFGAPTTDANAIVDVDDNSPFAGPMGPLSAAGATAGDTFPFTYSQEFAHDGDACGVVEYPNLARVLGDGNVVLDSATATVTVTIICPEFQGETVTGAGEEWPGSSNWFEYTDATSGEHDLIQGRNKNVVGLVTITQVGDVATLCFSLESPWELDPDKSGNVKIEPLDAAPTEYLPPGQYSFHFTRSGSSFCVDVDAGTFGYAIHLDAGFWVS